MHDLYNVAVQIVIFLSPWKFYSKGPQYMKKFELSLTICTALEPTIYMVGSISRLLRYVPVNWGAYLLDWWEPTTHWWTVRWPVVSCIVRGAHPNHFSSHWWDVLPNGIHWICRFDRYASPLWSCKPKELEEDAADFDTISRVYLCLISTIWLYVFWIMTAESLLQWPNYPRGDTCRANDCLWQVVALSVKKLKQLVYFQAQWGLWNYAYNMSKKGHANSCNAM